jgi:nuclear transport factor 2 (NTF2) superfamily protein
MGDATALQASSKVAAARSRKAKTLKAVRHSGSSVDRQETEVARFRRERDEALKQQAATSEVLRVISEPWAFVTNPSLAARLLIGSIRRECLDHFVIVG